MKLKKRRLTKEWSTVWSSTLHADDILQNTKESQRKQCLNFIQSQFRHVTKSVIRNLTTAFSFFFKLNVSGP